MTVIIYIKKIREQNIVICFWRKCDSCDDSSLKMMRLIVSNTNKFMLQKTHFKEEEEEEGEQEGEEEGGNLS